MKRNINNFRLNKNGKPITSEIGEVKHKLYQGASYKEDGEYYFYKRFFNGFYYYSN